MREHTDGMVRDFERNLRAERTRPQRGKKKLNVRSGRIIQKPTVTTNSTDFVDQVLIDGHVVCVFPRTVSTGGLLGRGREATELARKLRIRLKGYTKEVG